MKEKPALEDAIREFKHVFMEEAVLPWTLPTLRWFDRQIRRWPRLYRWLS